MIGVVEVGQLGPHPLRRLEHVRQLRPVLALEPHDPVEPGPDLFQALGIVVDRRRVVPDPAPHALHEVLGLGDLGHDLRQRRVEGGEPLDGAAGRGQELRGRALGVVEDLVRGGRPAGELLAVLVPPGLRFEIRILPRRQIGFVDLVQLEAQEVRASLDVAPTLFADLQRVPELLHPLVSLTDRGGEGGAPAIGVEDGSLVPRAQERLMLVLPVEIDQCRAEVADDARGRGRTVDPRPIPTRGGDLPAQDQEVVLEPKAVLVGEYAYRGHVADVEDRLHRGSVGPGPHHVRRRPLPQEERQCAHDDRLACPGLAREGIESGGELEVRSSTTA